MRFLLTAFALVTFVGLSTAADAAWQVVRVTGTATAAPSGAVPFRLRSGTTVPDNVTIETGSSGRVMLKRGTSTIMVAPRTAMTLDEGLFGITTTVLQRVGQIDFQVEKRDVRYFSVETPSMAAVVKGTRFSVRVAGGRTNVGVSRGLVGVTDLDSGASADIAPGQQASTAGRGLHLSGRGSKPPITAGQPRSARVQSLSPNAVAADVRAVPANDDSDVDEGDNDQGHGRGRSRGHGNDRSGGHGHGGNDGGSDRDGGDDHGGGGHGGGHGEGHGGGHGHGD